ncbi:DUF1491 family protein [Sphingomonas naphthae]
MVLAKGDATSGAILIVILERGALRGLHERIPGAGGYTLAPTGPADPAAPGALTDYLARRRRSDPDLWVVELDGDGDMPLRVAAELLG